MVTVLSRQAGRRYTQITCAMALVWSSTSQGSPPAPSQTIAHRRFPQSAYSGNGSSRAVRLWVQSSVGTPSGGPAGGGALSRALAVNNVMEPLKQSTARELMVFLVQNGDHITGAAGLTLTVTISKNGGTFATITPTINDRGNGWYDISLATGNTDTLGDLAFHISATGADPCDFKVPVELDRTGATVSSVVSTVSANLLTWLGGTPNALISGRVDSDVTNDMQTKTFGESAAVVGATASFKDMLVWLKTLARNKITQTNSTSTLRNDGDSVSVSTSAISDDGTTFTRGKWQ